MFKKNSTPIEKGLSIIIIGCGKVGSTITEQLYREGHDITVVDKNASAVQALSNSFDVMGIVGNGASYSVLNEAGIDKADLIIAVTASDELNLLCCTVARRSGNCAAIARVRNPDYSEEVGYLRERLGITMIINPELEAANEISRILRLPSALNVSPFAGGRAELVKFKLPADNMLCGQSLAELGRSVARSILFCAIERGDEVFIPNGSFRLQKDDVISFVASSAAALEFFENAGFENHRVRNCMLIGGGKATYYLARQLLATGVDVTIIDKDPARCDELTDLLPGAVIICGDGADEDLLREEGIDRTEAFIPLTGLDEENILMTLYAREVSDAKLITKLNRISFRGVINKLALGSVVYPKYITTETIVAYVRARRNSIGSSIETLYHLCDNRAEAVEFKVGSVEGITGIPLKDLGATLKDNLLIACINRKGRAIIPGGLDAIQPGDSVVIVTTHTGLHDIRDILQ